MSASVCGNVDHVAALLGAVRAASALLRSHSEDRWATWLDADAERIASGDGYGVEHLLRAFGGMGSLNDVSLPNRADDDRLWSLRDVIWSNARAIQRQRG